MSAQYWQARAADRERPPRRPSPTARASPPPRLPQRPRRLPARWERFCFVVFAVPCFWRAISLPTTYTVLTNWTLALHAVYFSVCKSSAHSTPLVRLLHGMSWGGCIAVVVGYTFLMAFGVPAHGGSWYTWEIEMDKLSMPGQPPWPFWTKLTTNLYQHAWPVVALSVDLALSKSQLRGAYASAGALSRAWFIFGGYFVFGSVWQHFCAKGELSALDRYAMPRWLHSAELLGYATERLGVTAPAELSAFAASNDAIAFNFFMKVVLVGTLVGTNRRVLSSVLGLGAPSKAKASRATRRAKAA